MYVIRRPPITLAGDEITEDDRAAVAQWISDGGDLHGSAECSRFEAALAHWLGARHVVMVNSGASANLLMLSALKPRLRNRRVALAELGRATTVAPLMQLGFDPHLCACDPNTLRLDLAALEELFQRERPALLLLHHMMPVDMGAVAALCARHDVVLLEDARDALGATCNGRRLGRFGTAASYSLRSGTVLSCMEGGVVVCDDAELVATMRALRGRSGAVELAGFRMQPGEINGFLGHRKLSRLDHELERRAENHAVYQRELLRFYPQQGDDAARDQMLMDHVGSDPTLVCSSGFGIQVKNRDETADFLRQNRVESQPMPTRHIAQMPFWQQSYGASAAQHECRGLMLPLHAGLDSVDIVRISELFKQIAQPIMPAASTAQSAQA